MTLEEQSIPFTDTSEFKPLELTSYMNKPHVFKSREDFDSFVQKAKNETLDSLYRKVKSIWCKYIDADLVETKRHNEWSFYHLPE
jgi:hypothetical protein